MSTSNPASAASLAALTKSGRETVPNSGRMKMAARLSVPVSSIYFPSAHTRLPGQGDNEIKSILSSLCAC